jgi:ribonucleoside-triphosphate reductase
VSLWFKGKKIYQMEEEEKLPKDDPSTLEIMVGHGEDELQPFDVQQLAERLVRETGISAELAGKISLDIKQLVRQMGLRLICPSLIRGLIDTKLIEYGLEDEYNRQIHLGLPLREVDRMVQQLERTRGVRPLNPRETSIHLAGSLKRDYAMLAVFSEEVAAAHRVGEIQIENINEVDCIHSLCLSPDYLKRIGPLLPTGVGVARPPRNVEEFVSYLLQSSLQLGHCLSGPLCWDSLNFALAPLIADWSGQALRVLSEMLIQQFNALSRDCEFYLDWHAPAYLADRRAVGLDGSELSGSYRDFTGAARQLLVALLEVYLSGDQIGLPLLNPRPVVYMPGEMLADGVVFDLLSRLARERGQCEVRYAHSNHDTFAERYGLRLTQAMQQGSWEWRTAVFQAVALNLPRAAFKAQGDQVRVLENLTELLDLAAQAHLEKRIYVEKLLAQGENGPLALLARRHQGSALLKLNRTAYWICPVGLNEMVQATLGQYLHESDEALKFGEHVCRYLSGETERLSAKHKVHFLLAQLKNQETARRFAYLDMRHFPEAVADSFQSPAFSEETGYTLGAGLPSGAVLSPAERISKEASLQADSFHGAATTWRVPASPFPFAEEAREWLVATMNEPLSPGLRFHLDFAVCLDCQSALRGHPPSCPVCHSTRVQQYI